MRDLRYAFPKVEAELAEGKEIEMVKRGKVVARLVPVAPEPTVLERGPVLTAEFMIDRLRRVWGNRMFDITGAELIRQDRDGI